MADDRYIKTEDLGREPYTNRERIEHLALAARDALSPLYDALEDEINEAHEDDDIAAVLMIGWFYGMVSALVTEIETHFA